MKFIAPVFFIVLLFPVETFAQSELKFKNINTSQGLSQSTVQCIFKDSRGFMWFGTRDGLNRYDGYSFKIFKNNPRDENSISNNFINYIFEDSKNNLWVCTRKGINKFDREQNRFIHFNKEGGHLWVVSVIEDNNGKMWLATRTGFYEFDPVTWKYKMYQHSQIDPLNNGVNQITMDSNGEIWLATILGVRRFNIKTKTYKHYLEDTAQVHGVDFDYINMIYCDKEKKIWAGTNEGALLQYDPKSDSFISIIDLLGNSNVSGKQIFLTITEGPDGQMWIGTENEGLLIYDYKSKTFTAHKNNANDQTSIASNAIRCIYKDDLENMWVGTYSGGIDLMPRFNKKFFHSKKGSVIGTGLNNDIVKSIQEDADGGLWIGTDGGGINYLDQKSNTYKYYLNEPDNVNSVSSNNNHCIIELNKDTLAFGYHRGGFDLFSRRTGKFTHFLPEPGNPNSLSYVTVSSLYKDRKGNLWIGTWGGGLNFLDIKSGKFKVYKVNHDDPTTIVCNLIYSIKEDREGKLWVATEHGVELYNEEKNSFTHYLCDTAMNERVYSIHIDKKNNLWVGTLGGGLNLLNKKTGKFLKYNEVDGLPSNTVNSILEDSQGNLWLGTIKGISRFNPETKLFRNFGIEDGLQSNEFKRNSCFKSKDGKLFFGGVNGFNSFYPEQIIDNPFLPPVVLTGFQIFNKPVEIDKEDSPLKKDISETRDITLLHSHSVFTFQFAALNFTLPEMNQYAYKLEGFDKEWNYVGTERKATYTNLYPGKYIFRVKASNNDGVWNERGTSIVIKITPPFWMTWWFRALVILSIMGSAFVWYRNRINVIERQKKMLEEQVKQRTEELGIANEELSEQKEELIVQAINLQEVNEELHAQALSLQEANEEISILYSEIKDSIKAAQVIQNAILPLESTIKEHIPESFVLYKPKDVVSGDFYWFDETDDKIIVAAVDCTGHGVSGAFMSINAHHLLNQVIYFHRNQQANEILDRLNESVIQEFERQSDETQIYDGMDISLCIIEKNERKIQFSGANNPLYILRDKNIIQVKANKFAVGRPVIGKVSSFTNHIIEIHENDIFYIFSDGYADQLGGIDGEKFLYSRFRELLIQIGSKNMEEQHQSLNENFEAWKGAGEQVDDILVMGFKV